MEWMHDGRRQSDTKQRLCDDGDLAADERKLPREVAGVSKGSFPTYNDCLRHRDHFLDRGHSYEGD